MCDCMRTLTALLADSSIHPHCPHMHTPPGAIYEFTQPCDLTLSQATSTSGHVTRQAEIWPVPHIP